MRNLSQTAQTDLETFLRNLKIDPNCVTCKPSMRSYETGLKGVVSAAKTSDPGCDYTCRYVFVVLHICRRLHLEASEVSPRYANDCYNSLNTIKVSSLVLHNTDKSSA